MEIFLDNFTPAAGGRGCAVALGNFDGIHRGHAKLLSSCVERARERGLYSLCFTFKTHPSVLFGRDTPLITTNEEKTEIIEALGFDGILFMDFDAKFSLLSPDLFFREILMRELSAKAVFCGEHYRFGIERSGDADMLGELCGSEGIELFAVPLLYDGKEVISSSQIRSLILKGELSRAAELLGRPFAICGPVLRGRGIGRGIGFPTINQAFPKGLIQPKNGVYKSRTVITTSPKIITSRSVTNIGVAPTVGGGHLRCETYLMDGEGDFYAAQARVELLRFIREERRFDSPEELALQIKRDIEEALKD